MLDVAQCFSGRYQILPEALQRGLLFGTQNDGRLVFFALLQILDFAFGVFQALLQGLFFLPVPRFGFLLNGPDQGERTREAPPVSDADQVVTAGQIVQGISHEIVVRGGRDPDPLSQKVLGLDPKPVLEHVGVRHHDDVDRLRGFGHVQALFGLLVVLGSLRFLWFVRFLSGRPAVGKRRFHLAGQAGG